MGTENTFLASPHKLRSCFAAFGAILLGIILLYLSLTMTESLASPPSLKTYDSVQLTLLDEHHQPIADQEQLVAPLLKAESAYIYYDYQKGKYGRFTHTFEWDGSTQDHALFLAWSRRIDRVELNGKPIANRGALSLGPMHGGFQPSVFPLDTSLLKFGPNVITIDDVGGRRNKVLPLFSIVPLTEAYEAQFWGRFFETDFVIAGTGIMAFMVLLCLLVKWPATDRWWMAAFITLMLVWIVKNLVGQGLGSDLPLRPKVFIGFGLSFTLAAAYASLVALRVRSAPWVMWTIALTYCLFMLVFLVATLVSTQLMVSTIFAIEPWYILVICLISLLLIVYGWLSDEKLKLVDSVIFVIGLGAIFIDGIDHAFPIFVGLSEPYAISTYVTPRYGVLIALGITSTMAYEQSRGRQLAVDMNAELNRKLKDKEKELERAFQLRTEFQKREARLNERERIMMDVHDGLGARLLNLQLLTQSPPVDHMILNSEIEESLAEIRSITDKINTTDGDWEIALTRLYHRISKQFEAAGVTLEWGISDHILKLPHDAHTSDHVSKIVLEACSNIVRHARAKKVSIRFSLMSDEFVLDVIDDGCGYEKTASQGQGLRSMRTRASSLNGELTFVPVSLGTHLRLNFENR